jgi:hypothetical protein
MLQQLGKPGLPAGRFEQRVAFEPWQARKPAVGGGTKPLHGLVCLSQLR